MSNQKCLLAIVALLLPTTGFAAEPVDFAKQILPILSDKCFVCHGPDTNEETELRLDSYEAATNGGAIDAEELHASELIVRVFSTDDPMPPTDAERQLSDADRELLKAWVEQGAGYAQHWSFVTPKQQQAFSNASAAIDHYIGLPLKQQKIVPAPIADPATLARRVAFVLTGLPPDPDDLKLFLSDPTEAAYEHLVQQLLLSPRFGEHQARYWLDAVRYGDTHGLHLDNRRGIYPYRDWVVRAFNQNLPFDQFIQWQLAGDLLPQPTLDQLVATGYVRMNPSTGEGGAISQEFQMKNNFDRVETLGTVFLGMSLTCARCHTHKYDPIEQTEYYKLLAFFNNTAEPALDGNSYTYGPTVKTPADQDAWQNWESLKQQRDQLLAQYGEVGEAAAVQYAQSCVPWSTANWQISKPVNTGTEPKPESFGGAKGLPGAISGRAARGKLPNANQAVWVTFEITVPAEQTLDIGFNGGAGSHLLIDDLNVPIAEKASSLDAYPAPIRIAKGTHRLRLVIQGHGQLNALEVQVSSRWDSLAVSNSWKKSDPIAKLKMLADPAGPLAKSENGEVDRVCSQWQKLEANFTTSLIAKELPEPRETKLLRRGEYSEPQGDPLLPDTLQVLNPFPDQAPRNRMGLAKWLTDERHPLVTRVLVNRIWQRVFGHALVRTPEEFGLQGEQPTHPELLDWLAVDFRTQGWDLKSMLRSMVTSHTFKQSSVYRNDVDDPENRLYARAAAYRLDAEVLRDVGLWSSGLLDPRMGGEGVKPYQPVGMWQALAHPASNTKQYQPDSGDLLYRRSLYVYWKRTSPHPMMTLFDAPDRESSCVRRSRTNTPLQSLGMLNETQRIEMSRALATRLIKEQATDADRIDWLFKMLACRVANAPERAACLQLLSTMRERYEADATAAAELLSQGEVKRDDSIAAAELAAWTQVATTILASDVAIMLY